MGYCVRFQYLKLLYHSRIIIKILILSTSYVLALKCSLISDITFNDRILFHTLPKGIIYRNEIKGKIYPYMNKNKIIEIIIE